VPTTNTQQSKVRVILIELQRLFAQMLLLDQDSCSTNRLTDSFGWSNNEEMQQHDVQELNRILFAAIEKSLVNTQQSKLIQELYRGTYVNKIKCLTCQNVFEREEEYLDLQITVQGSSDLRTSLVNSFVMRENMDGNNQYKCERCNNEYRDAERYCQLKVYLTFFCPSRLS
jgi:ubiquitin carboxyl-terminal hydrolase 40